MAGLIKKQILKILTKFTDGLQPDDIQALDTNVFNFFLLILNYM